MTTKVAVIGASLGGVMAAWQLCHQGIDTLLVSEFDWIGGQLTSQAVPPDEHPYIESFGASASYYAFRQAMRQHYQQQPEFTDNSVLTEGCNPGDGWVSRLCFEPEVAEHYLRSLLAPFIASGRLQLIEHSRPVAVFCKARRIEQVQIINRCAEKHSINADYFLDATDTGELLALAGIDYRLGKESQAEYGERQAPTVADRFDQQPVTYVFAMRKLAQRQSPIAKPQQYDFWRDYVLPCYQYPIFSEYLPGHQGFSKVRLPLFAQGDVLDLWRYRRVVASHNWADQRPDVSLINWAQNDYALNPLLDGQQISSEEVCQAAKQLSRCLVYWLQTEAPRISVGEEGCGFPELVLAEDVLGTDDGFAQQVYVRESRRIIGLQTLTQSDIELVDDDTTWRPAQCANSVGIGLYNMDIHPTCRSFMGTNAWVRPFELPLGIFIAEQLDNLLPACKNLSVTHLVNAATRVHPIEWLIGEVAGSLAAFCLDTAELPRRVYDTPDHVKQFQTRLTELGIPLHWPQNPVNEHRSEGN